MINEYCIIYYQSFIIRHQSIPPNPIHFSLVIHHSFPMKTVLLSIALLVAIGPTTVFAQAAQPTTDYQTAMTNALTRFKALPRTAKPADLQLVANQFERIARATPGQWLPAYYAGLVYNLIGFSAGDDADIKDQYLDKADRWAAQADKISPDNDEIQVLMAQIAQGRLAASPMFRWMKYGDVSTAALKKARRLNPNNPRIYLLEGTSIMYKPGMFGGGPDEACPVLMVAAQKFAAFKPAGPLHPDWGQANLKKMMARCQKTNP
jgi:hypothetical protein